MEFISLLEFVVVVAVTDATMKRMPLLLNYFCMRLRQVGCCIYSS